MRRNVPPAALEKLLALSDAAETLSAQLVRSEDALRDTQRLGGSNSQQEYDDLRRALDQLVATQPALKKRCDQAQSVYSRCRAWLDRLPGESVLQPVACNLAGRNLESVRRTLASLEQEQRAIQTAPPPPSELQTAVKRYVAAIAEVPDSVLHNGEISPRCGMQTSFGPDPGRAPRSVWGTLAWLFSDMLVNRLQALVNAQADELQKLTRPQRAARLADIERELAELSYIEEALVERALANGETAERRSNARPEAILAVRIAREPPVARGRAAQAAQAAE